ncbi:MAG: hypothetical protein RIT27_1748 [Pseudomonadota bacterium]|jgi:hypothetical protein
MKLFIINAYKSPQVMYGGCRGGGGSTSCCGGQG